MIINHLPNPNSYSLMLNQCEFSGRIQTPENQTPATIDVHSKIMTIFTNQMLQSQATNLRHISECVGVAKIGHDPFDFQSVCLAKSSEQLTFRAEIDTITLTVKQNLHSFTRILSQSAIFNDSSVDPSKLPSRIDYAEIHQFPL
jgi:hypothetical protein